jgi:hypothetical protein
MPKLLRGRPELFERRTPTFSLLPVAVLRDLALWQGFLQCSDALGRDLRSAQVQRFQVAQAVWTLQAVIGYFADSQGQPLQALQFGSSSLGCEATWTAHQLAVY